MFARPPLVVALAYDGLCTFEFGCAVEVFGVPRPEFDPPLYRFATCAVDHGPLRAAGGLRVEAGHGLEILSEARTVIVPGWKGATTAPSQELAEALRAAHKAGARIASICSGATVLAFAGLLDGRKATTHWRYAESFRRLFPAVEVVEDVLYIDEGQILTSAGSAAGLDLCLHMVRQDYGPEIANAVARRLIIAPHRDGGQAQFVRQPVPPPDRAGRLAPLLDRVKGDLKRHYSVADLAELSGISQRSLLRRFREATGSPPHDWLIKQRVRKAQEMLEASDMAIETIAFECGFGSPESLRHHFRRVAQTTPGRYRKSFGRNSPELHKECLTGRGAVT